MACPNLCRFSYVENTPLEVLWQWIRVLPDLFSGLRWFDVPVFFGGTIAWPSMGGLRIHMDGMHTTHHSEGRAASPRTEAIELRNGFAQIRCTGWRTLWSPASFLCFPPNPAFPSATSLSLSCLSSWRTASSSAAGESSPCSSLTFATTRSTTAWGTASPLSAEMARETFERFFFFLDGRDGPDSAEAAAGTSASDSEPDSSPTSASASAMGCSSEGPAFSGALALSEAMLVWRGRELMPTISISND